MGCGASKQKAKEAEQLERAAFQAKRAAERAAAEEAKAQKAEADAAAAVLAAKAEQAADARRRAEEQASLECAKRELEARDAKQTAAYEKKSLDVAKTREWLAASRIHRVKLDVSPAWTASESVFTDVKYNNTIQRVMTHFGRQSDFQQALAEATATAKEEGGTVDGAVLGVRVDGVVVDMNAVYEYQPVPLVVITGLCTDAPTAEDLEGERAHMRRDTEAMLSKRAHKLEQREKALNAELLPFACDKRMCSQRFFLESDLERHCTVDNCLIRKQEARHAEVVAAHKRDFDPKIFKLQNEFWSTRPRTAKFTYWKCSGLCGEVFCDELEGSRREAAHKRTCAGVKRNAAIVARQYAAYSSAVNARNKAKMDAVLQAEAAREKAGAEYRRKAENAARSKALQIQREDASAAYFGMKIRR